MHLLYIVVFTLAFWSYWCHDLLCLFSQLKLNHQLYCDEIAEAMKRLAVACRNLGSF